MRHKRNRQLQMNFGMQTTEVLLTREVEQQLVDALAELLAVASGEDSDDRSSEDESQDQR